MDDDLLGFIGFWFVLLTALFVFGFGLWFCSNWFIDRPACTAYGQLTHQETYFSLGTNCLVKYNGQWVKYDIAAGQKQEITIK